MYLIMYSDEKKDANFPHSRNFIVSRLLSRSITGTLYFVGKGIKNVSLLIPVLILAYLLVIIPEKMDTFIKTFCLSRQRNKQFASLFACTPGSAFEQYSVKVQKLVMCSLFLLVKVWCTSYMAVLPVLLFKVYSLNYS